MCGIFCSIFNDGNVQCIDEQLFELLRNRGPDDFQVSPIGNVLLGGFVLWQQGESLTTQPASLNSWTILLNGDIFNKDCAHGMSDTSWILQKLDATTNEGDILDLLKSLKGPYSIILYNAECGSLYFARDALGRNSLLVERDANQFRVLSNSVIDHLNEGKCTELPPYGLYKINVANSQTLTVYPWKQQSEEDTNDFQELKTLFSNIIINESISPEWLSSNQCLMGKFDFYDLSKSKDNSNGDIFGYLLENECVKNSISQFLKLLRYSVKERVSNTPPFCNSCLKTTNLNCNHSKIAILFSGGIDCTIIAKIADEFISENDPIDLINVAFEAPNAKEINWNVPDRCSAKESYTELKNLCPTRNWKLVEVNVTRSELKRELESHIKHLIYPLNTILDESLGCAFWFASRGEGFVNGEAYKSSARIVLIGSGADELFGGYTRHRNAFTRCTGSHNAKIVSLFNELEVDWKRIPSRNLARDDRVIADTGKTSRAPFIQEDVVRFVRGLTPEQRCCFTLEQGIGDKLFLRLCGREIGLSNSVKLRKRAVQFGSRIANKNQNAKDISISIR